jgi:hypothetical protein
MYKYLKKLIKIKDTTLPGFSPRHYYQTVCGVLRTEAVSQEVKQQ